MTTGRPPIPGEGTRSSNELRQLLSENFAVLDKLCNSLEQVANTLPERADVARCNELAGQLYTTLKGAHDFEEKRLFPLLLQQSGHMENLANILERLRFEHWEDEAYADEVQEALRNFAKAPQQSNVESLSWMLRGFFECVRRHVAFERDYVLPMIRS